MEPITPCNSYAARPSGRELYRCGPSCFKVYYVDIYGRQQPERFEWDLCGRPRTSVLERLEAAAIEGVGVVVAFPHITKVFRFAPSAETIMHVRAFWTPSFEEVDLRREEGYLEFACYAEAVIAAEEYRLWAEADSVEAYLTRWADWSDATVTDHAKLARHFAEG
jgi:hypothetical protein